MSGVLDALELIAEILVPVLRAVKDGRDLSPEERVMVSVRVDMVGDRLRKASGREKPAA